MRLLPTEGLGIDEAAIQPGYRFAWSHMKPVPRVLIVIGFYLADRGLNCSVRATRGTDISAACGQLGKTRQQVSEHD